MQQGTSKDRVKSESEGGRDGSGVAGGQVKTTKYIVFRNVTASFFSRNFGYFHGKHLNFLFFVRCTLFLVYSIAYRAQIKQVFGQTCGKEGDGWEELDQVAYMKAALVE